MWPFSSYPESSASEVDGKTYDYIIVGDKGYVKDNLVSRIPLLSQNFWLGDPLQVQGSYYTEPIANANGRKNRLWTAEGLGGASRINAMLLTRGIPAGYIEWAQKYGLDEWGWDQVEPYFKKSENSIAHRGSHWRGDTGPISVTQSFPPFKWTSYIGKAVQQLGLPVEDDYNDPNAPAMGLFRLDMAIDEQGRRVSADKAFLSKDTAIRRRRHLTICTGVVASHLEIDKQAGLVHGVHISPVNVQGNKSNRKSYVKARREVIVCSGAIASPLVLMRSGIGPRKQLEALGIDVAKELPVGANLQDHYSFAIMLGLPKFETFSVLESIWGLWHFLLWILLGTGLFSKSSTPLSVFLRTTTLDDDTMTVKANPENLNGKEPRNIPDAEIMIQPVNSFERAISGVPLLSFFATMAQPQSVGSVELVSSDPFALPRITHPILRDPRDWEPIRRVTRFTMRLAEEFQKSGYPYSAPLAFAPGVNLDALRKWETTIPSSVPKEYSIGVKPMGPQEGSTEKKPAPQVEPRTWKTLTDDEIDDYVRRVAMGTMHVACTCPMSQDKNTGVVDQKLRVHGFKNLRVADASVFPKIPSAHTMAATIMVAERCADFIKDSLDDSSKSY